MCHNYIFSCVSSSINLSFTNKLTNEQTLSSFQNRTGLDRSGKVSPSRDRSEDIKTVQDRSRQARIVQVKMGKD